MSGILDFLSKVGQPAAATSTGVMPAPSPWQNRIGLFGATLKDIGADLGGRPADAVNIAGFQQGQQQQTAQATQLQARTALSQALSTNDPMKIKAAAMAFAASGGDLSNFATALKFGQPTIDHYSADDASYSTDPFTNVRTQLSPGAPKPPPTTGGMQWDSKTGTWIQIPHYVEQQSAIYNARDAAAAAHRAPAKAAAMPHGVPVYGTPQL